MSCFGAIRGFWLAAEKAASCFARTKGATLERDDRGPATALGLLFECQRPRSIYHSSANDRAIACAIRNPSHAADMMPPAYPGPSPQGYTPLSYGASSGRSSRDPPCFASAREPLTHEPSALLCAEAQYAWKFLLRQMRTGEDERVSGAVINAFGSSK